MRTKLFLSFFLVIIIALLSNVVFERLIINDFNAYVKGSEEDRIYWIMASVEGSYKNGQWDQLLLQEAVHWAAMLGFETYVVDENNKQIISTSDIFTHLNPVMLKRMASLFELPTGYGDFTWYPLYVEGKEIGRIYFRPLKRLGFLPKKEEIFRKRGRQFLFITFAIAGGGAIFLSFVFTFYLSKPLRLLTEAAEKVASGNFSIRVKLNQGPFSRLFRTKDEIERLSETFNYMVSALEREDALRKHLTSNIAHELRTPLTIVKGNLEAVEDGIIEDPKEVLSNIKAEIDRIIDLVQGIEDITHAEASFFKKGSKEEIELSEFIKNIVDSYQSVVKEKGLFIKTRGPVMKIKTYPDKLHIILKNLINNAYRYTDQGGITVSWGSSERGFFIMVEDTGRGMDNEEQKRIFNRFYKGRSSKGRGLGLSIVKELIETLGAEINVKSEPGKGSVFRVDFPAS